ncbi:Cytochrome C oxidase, cbb3-type, subunit III [Nannocystis exedens]|uniref:Cytochrome C oxidase, cbb3-type, subunit III n=1 Tax=Nannocystis exedens TaxID=54 RepID=A0A1I2EZV1_9BACT|nr:c-type cytochrome [Nannocystis exedens]PCC69580.1 Cbb3-type cytochrome c oxidase subunit CcoP [Nannocystis exedens]SFE98694.1 Cytochrome C oxidase, cbb3-type, subunit III [Nannocystis exedens]
MEIAASVTLGLLFLISGFASLFLMFKLWGWPDGHQPGMSKAPLHLVRLHDIFKVVFTALYVVMMIVMVPRLWNYQVELPPRSAVHVSLGFLLGVLLIVELTFYRVFRHLQDWVPPLATAVLGCAVLLLGLSVPSALREFGLARGQVGGGVYSVENRARVARLLPLAEMPADAPLADLTTVEALRHGREILATKCVVCHDLKTVLVQPRAPAGWWRTVERMADKPTFDDPLTERELYDVTAYLIAITGDLQRSARQQREQRLKQQQAIAPVDPAAPAPAYDAAAAQKAFETRCSECHELAEVDKKPPTSAREVKEVIERMVADNGMTAPAGELDLCYAFMVRKYAPNEVATAPATLGAAVGAEVQAAVAVASAPPAPSDSKPVPSDSKPTPADVPPPAAEPDVVLDDAPPAAPAAPAAKPKPAAKAIDARGLYVKHCAACHDVSGKGKPGLKSKGIPDMTDKNWQKKHGKASVARAIKAGIPGTMMKAFAAKMKPEEIDAVAAFVKKMR